MAELHTPTLECWSVLAALAARVPRLALGPVVCGATYRKPYLLAKTAATVDHVSGGRVVLGIGAAWQENEHVAYGVAFPPLAARLARLEESCAALRSLFGDATTPLAGRHGALHGALFGPQPGGARVCARQTRCRRPSRSASAAAASASRCASRRAGPTRGTRGAHPT